MKTTNQPLARLRHHVTGAIERGEAQAIVGIPAMKTQTNTETAQQAQHTLRATWTIRNLTEQSIEALTTLPSARAQWEHLQKLSRHLPHCVSSRIGYGDAFRDRVEWNQLFRSNRPLTFKLEPRKGYKLATFQFTTASDKET